MSTSRIGPAPRWAIVASGILVLLGVAVASYLTYSHYSASTLAACPDTGLINCQKVTSSAQSKILGIPVAVLGLAYFISAIAFEAAERVHEPDRPSGDDVLEQDAARELAVHAEGDAADERQVRFDLTVREGGRADARARLGNLEVECLGQRSD